MNIEERDTLFDEYEDNNKESEERKIIFTNCGFVNLQANINQGFCLNNSTLGFDFLNTRIGRVINIHSLELNGWAYSNLGADLQKSGSGANTTMVSACMLRLLIFIDYQTNGAPVANTKLYQQGNPAFMNPVNFSLESRIKVIHDEAWTFGPCWINEAGNVVAFGDKQSHIIRVCKKFDPPLRTVYNNNNVQNATAIQTGGLFAYWSSSCVAPMLGGDNREISGNFQCVVRFTDD